MTVAAVPRLGAGAALARGRDALLARQDPAGWWKGELETNVTMDAEDLLLRELLGIRTPEVTRRAAHWIRSRQRIDGTWATFHAGPPDLSTTIEAYTALRLAGDPVDADHMQQAVAFVRDAGGIERARVFTRIWLALFGEWDWSALPTLPPEMIFLPSWCPLNVYDFACWARQTIVPLTIVASSRPVHPLPFTLAELHGAPVARERSTPWTLEGRFRVLDRVLARYDRRPFRSLRSSALAAAERWIVDRQEADGSWGGIQPPWVYSLLALSVRGYPLDHPVMRAGLAGLEAFVIDDDRGRRLEACQSPVWDTALAVVALADAGVAPDDPALVRAADFLLGHEVRTAGDWSVRRPRLEPGGWAFEFANANYPDVDDTAEVVMALRRVEHPDAARVDAAVARAVRWVEGMQCRNGGWAAFDVDNTSRACGRLPFCDFGEVTDPPSADVTAHVLEMLAAEPAADPRPFAAGVAWLEQQQEPEGSWFGRWGVNHVYGTGAALPALRAGGLTPDATPMQAAVRWLETHQNADGGWGEDIRSYRDAASRGHGVSTASQTAWALLALLAAGVRSDATSRGVRWLVETQRADGTWDEPWFTGTGFPGDFSINYHLYRQVFPVMALGRFVHGPDAPSGVAR